MSVFFVFLQFILVYHKFPNSTLFFYTQCVDILPVISFHLININSMFYAIYLSFIQVFDSINNVISLPEGCWLHCCLLSSGDMGLMSRQGWSQAEEASRLKPRYHQNTLYCKRHTFFFSTCFPVCSALFDKTSICQFIQNAAWRLLTCPWQKGFSSVGQASL